MKTHTLLLPLLALAAPAAAQRTELVGRLGAGLFRFGGESATNTAAVSYQNDGNAVNGYTLGPYGSKLGLGVAVGGRVQRVGARRGLLALDLGYEWLRSRTSINEVYYSSSPFSSFVAFYSANGSTYLQNQNLTAFLGFGHRFELGSIDVDALVGPEAAYVYGFREKGSGTYNGDTPWTSDRSRAGNRGDARLRADATAWCHRVGFNASYSYGLLNYQGGLLGGSPQVYSRTLRLGVAYRLR